MKNIFDFRKSQKLLRGEEISTHRNVDFMLIAELEDDERYYASTIKSELASRFEWNHADEIDNIALVKKNGGEEYLQILSVNGEKKNLKSGSYFLFFYAPQSTSKAVDCVLVFHMPALLWDGVHWQIFLDDGESGNALSLFWLLKELIIY